MKLISGHNDKFDLFCFFFYPFQFFYSSLQTYKNMSNKIEIFENLSVYFLDSHTMYIVNMRPVKNSRWSVMKIESADIQTLGLYDHIPNVW